MSRPKPKAKCARCGKAPESKGVRKWVAMTVEMCGECYEGHERRCVWTEDEDGTWNTDCRQSWTFIDAGPAENHVRFCHWCGQPVEARAWKGEE